MTLHHTVVGDGPACLVPHGGPGLHSGLYRSLDPLAAGRRLVFWDHRGHGRSGPLPDGPIDMKLFADDAVELADELSLDTFAVFGHSFGGWVAQELALQYPERVTSLVLANTTPGQLGADEPPDDDQGEAPPPEVIEMLSTIPARDEEVADGYRRIAPHFFRGGDPRLLTDALDVELVSAIGMAKVFDALSRWSAVDRLATIRCPTLVIGATDDVFCSPPQLVRIASRIPEAALVWFDTGHFPWADAPAAFFEVVDSWLPRFRARS